MGRLRYTSREEVPKDTHVTLVTQDRLLNRPPRTTYAPGTQDHDGEWIGVRTEGTDVDARRVTYWVPPTEVTQEDDPLRGPVV